MNKKIYSMLGLCIRAGMWAYGADMCEEKMKYGKVSMIIVACDASDNTKSKFKRICNKNVIYVEFGTIDEISHAIGKENKAIIGVLDSNFCKKINDMVIELKGAND